MACPVWDHDEHLGRVPTAPSSSEFRFTGGCIEAEEGCSRSATVKQACPARQREIVERWLTDTGCGTDLVSQGDADRCALATIHNGQPFAFNTSNGCAKSRLHAKLNVEELGQTAPACVLPPTPSVLTVGRRRTREGLSFVSQERCHIWYVLME